MKMTTRAALGWGPPQAARARPTQGLVIHYDGSAQGLANRPHSACIDYWKRTRKFHMGSRGWADIGYSFGACPHGVIFEGRGVGYVQAAQPGGNSTWYSVTLMSGPGEKPTPTQIDAVRQLRRWLMAQGVAGEVKGHRDFYSTSCPGDVLYRMVRDGTFTRSPSAQKGDDMPLTDADLKKIWTHEIPVPYGSQENPEWQARNVLTNHGVWLRKIAAKLDAQTATIEAQGAALREMAAALATHDTEIDVEALVGRIEAAIGQITVRLTVGEE